MKETVCMEVIREKIGNELKKIVKNDKDYEVDSEYYVRVLKDNGRKTTTYGNRWNTKDYNYRIFTTHIEVKSKTNFFGREVKTYENVIQVYITPALDTILYIDEKEKTILIKEKKFYSTIKKLFNKNEDMIVIKCWKGAT